jgi:large subunit ribosomal protein L21
MSPDTDSPYAIVKTGGKQYRVRSGQRLLVERLAVEEGKTLTLEPLMYRAEEIVCDGDALAKVKVTAKVIAHERGEKLRVFKFKPKRGYRRRTGHRQELTRIEVTDISLGAARKAAAKPKAAESKPAAEAKPAVESKPAVEAKPSVESKPAAEAKTKTTESKPAAEAKPKAAEAKQDKPKEANDGS